jgi:ribosome-associated protein
VTDPAAPSAKPARVRAASSKPASPKTAKPKAVTADASIPKATTTKVTTTKPATMKATTRKPATAKATTRKPATAKAPPPGPTRAKRATAKAVVAAKAGTAAKSRPGLPARAELVRQDRKESLATARRIVELAEDKKAAEIVLLDLGELTTLADAFVICSGGSERQLDAIADGIVSGLREQGVRPIGREGVAASHWVLLDFGGVVVHIFTPPERDFYELEKHWSEARTVLRVQ